MTLQTAINTGIFDYSKYTKKKEGKGRPKTTIGSLKNHIAKSGVPYMSGIVDIDGQQVDIMIFKNNYKVTPNDPDWTIVKKKKDVYKPKTMKEMKRSLNNSLLTYQPIHTDIWEEDSVPF